MTLQELRDRFITEYKFVAQTKGLKYVEPPNGVIAAWLSSAQQDLQNRLKISLTYEDFSIVAGTNTYTFTNSDFGSLQRVEYDGRDVDVVGVDMIDTTSSIAGSQPTVVAIYSNDGTWTLRVPETSVAYTLRVWYYKDFGYYSSGNSNWGSYSNSFSGSLKIPSKYLEAVIYYLMYKVTGDISYYENEVRKLRETRSITSKTGLSYRMNGGII